MQSLQPVQTRRVVTATDGRQLNAVAQSVWGEEFPPHAFFICGVRGHTAESHPCPRLTSLPRQPDLHTLYPLQTVLDMLQLRHPARQGLQCRLQHFQA